MAKVYVALAGDYEGLKAKRLNRFGRIERLKIINDGPPYWLVQIRNFSLARDRKAVGGPPWGNGVWRFANEADARRQFDRLTQVPKYARDEEKRLQLADARRQRVQAARMHLPKGGLGKFSP